jgi:ubiquinone/menaquinone biosynthesis C-methylase UbiE
VPPALSAEEIRDANTRYHDVAADHYDSKWGIDFGDLGLEQVTAKVRKALGREPGHFARSLEIGAGTGYFTLNLMRAGLIGEATCSDISPGMLETLEANARGLGLDVRSEPADAERLPFPDASFDLVFGHAVLHQIGRAHV